MATPEHPQKAEAWRAIQEHLQLYGPKNWNLVLERFPQIGSSTMWRWINLVRKEGQPIEALQSASKKIVQRTAGMINDATERAVAKGVEPIARHIPATPTPEYISQRGAQGLQNLDVVVEINVLYRDANMLRDYSLSLIDLPEGGQKEKIKNPVAFEKSILARNKLLETAIRTTQEIWDLRRMQDFYDTIIDEIGKESPETQRRIMLRLAELNARTGMTTAMRV